MRTIPYSLLILGLLFTAPVRAALTDSEKAQVKGFVQSGKLENAAKVRALVARPDLSVDEATEPLGAGFSAVAFDERHEKLAHEILLGPGSTAARSDLAPAVVRALLARASRAQAAMPQNETGRDALKADELSQEIVRIHRFVSESIANAGKPPADGHDGTAGFRDDSLEACARAYIAHIQANPTTLQQGKPISASLIPVRAQTALTTSDLARGLIQRHELSTAFGLSGAAKAFFDRHGTLIEDGGTASAARIAKLVALFDAVPAAAEGLGLWLVSKSSKSGLSSRGRIASARVSVSQDAGAPATGLWAEDVDPDPTDRELAEAAYSVAWTATRSAFAKSPALRMAAERSLARALSGGEEAYLSRDLPESVLAPEGVDWHGAPGASPEQYVVHALRLLLLDAPRTRAIALGRATHARYEPMEALLLALSVVASTSANPSDFEVGGEHFDKLEISNSVVTAFHISTRLTQVKKKVTVRSDAIQATLDGDGKVTKVLVSGQPPKLADIRYARLVPRAGTSWQVGKTKFEKLAGDPLAVVVDDQRVVVGASKKSTGFDAVVTGADSSDQSAHATIRPSGRGGGLLLRGQAGKDSYDGIVLLVTSEPTPKATLTLVDGRAHATELAPPIVLPKNDSGYRVSLSVRGVQVTGVVDGKKVEAKLTRGAGTGRIGLVTAAGGRIDVEGFAPGALPTKAPKAKAKP